MFVFYRYYVKLLIVIYEILKKKYGYWVLKLFLLGKKNGEKGCVNR